MASRSADCAWIVLYIFCSFLISSQVVTSQRWVSTVSKFRCEVMERSDEDRARQFLKREYFKREPISEMLGGFSQREIDHILDPCFPRVLNDGVSVVVDNLSSGQMVGVLLCVVETPTDKRTTVVPDVSGEIRKEDIFDDIVGNLSKSINLYHLCKVDKVLHMLIASVHSEEQGYGICTMMVKLAEQSAVFKGVELAVAESTGSISRKVLENHGYSVIKELQYTVKLDKSKSRQANILCSLAVKRLGL